MPDADPRRAPRFIVALDLGSESMSAYFEPVFDVGGGMVDLQAHAARLTEMSLDELTLIRDDEGSPSQRLRTRIGLKRSVDPKYAAAELPDGHAQLEFLDASGSKAPGYDETVFQFYHPEGSAGLDRLYLPNPKIPFQYGGEQMIPTVQPGSVGTKTRYTPESVIQHLTCQVVKNLLFRSPQLKSADPEEIELLLTVPNVYSQTHAERLRGAVERLLPRIGAVHTRYESDAVACYPLMVTDHRSDPEEVKEFRKAFLDQPDEGEVRVLTIDIGRGTTDLSLVSVVRGEAPPGAGDGRRLNLFVLGRTGLTEGGNGLTYVLARYFDGRVKQGIAQAVADGYIDGVAAEKDFRGFLQAPEGQPVGLQKKAIYLLHDYLETLKTTITSRPRLGAGVSLRIGLSPKRQKELLRETVAEIARALLMNRDSIKEGSEVPPAKASVDQLAKVPVFESIMEKLVLPATLPGDWTKVWLAITNQFGKLFPSSATTSAQLWLAAEVEEHVARNTTLLLEDLERGVKERERQTRTGDDPESKVFDRRNTFVVVAGQASHFEPMSKAITEWVRDHKGLDERSVVRMPGGLAKEACARGAVASLTSHLVFANAEELHGVYGFLNRTPGFRDDQYRKVDMGKVRAGGTDTVRFDTLSTYFLVFTPYHFPDDFVPSLEDGFTAIVQAYPRENSFQVRYSPQDQALFVNDRRITRLSVYGDISSEVYPKVWPEVLRPLD